MKRRLMRVGSGVLLCGVLAGPAVLGVWAKVWRRWRPLAGSAAWQRPGTTVFVGVGLGLALALWLWFAVAVGVETLRVLRHRGTPSEIGRAHV